MRRSAAYAPPSFNPQGEEDNNLLEVEDVFLKAHPPQKSRCSYLLVFK